MFILGLSENPRSNFFFKKWWTILLEYCLDFQRIKLVNPKLTAQILPCKIGNKNTGTPGLVLISLWTMGPWICLYATNLLKKNGFVVLGTVMKLPRNAFVLKIKAGCMSNIHLVILNQLHMKGNYFLYLSKYVKLS